MKLKKGLNDIYVYTVNFVYGRRRTFRKGGWIEFGKNRISIEEYNKTRRTILLFMPKNQQSNIIVMRNNIPFK